MHSPGDPDPTRQMDAATRTPDEAPAASMQTLLDQALTGPHHPHHLPDPTPYGPAPDPEAWTPHQPGAEWLRWVPPVAALGTAFVLQVVLVTDMLGAAIAARMSELYPDLAQPWVWFAVAGLMGLAVACSLEGSAAWLMHLYDQHLRTRDSVWLLRVGMLLYVALSAAMIHWWLSDRGLPELVAWVLAAMSGSALFLWSRGSRWRHRRQMLAAGQIDPALPRLPTATKLLHPLRSAVTIWLITWGPPVRTVDGARRRYEAWRRLRRQRRSRHQPSHQTPTNAAAAAAPGTGRTRRRPRRSARQGPDTGPGRGNRRKGAADTGPAAADEQLLTSLRQQFPDQLPSINQVQKLAGGGRSRAVRLRRALAEQPPGNDLRDVAAREPGGGGSDATGW